MDESKLPADNQPDPSYSIENIPRMYDALHRDRPDDVQKIILIVDDLNDKLNGFVRVDLASVPEAIQFDEEDTTMHVDQQHFQYELTPIDAFMTDKKIQVAAVATFPNPDSTNRLNLNSVEEIISLLVRALNASLDVHNLNSHVSISQNGSQEKTDVFCIFDRENDEYSVIIPIYLTRPAEKTLAEVLSTYPLAIWFSDQ